MLAEACREAVKTVPEGWHTVEVWAKRFRRQICAAADNLERLTREGKFKCARFQIPDKNGKGRMKRHWKFVGRLRPEHIRPAGK